VRYRFVHQHATQFPVSHLCRLLAVSAAGYYAWRTRPESPRTRANRDLVEQIKGVLQASRGTYGRRRVHAQLRAQGQTCSRNHIARLMRREGLCGRARRRVRVITTDSRHTFPVVPNRLAQQGPVTGPDQVWVSDITYLRTDEGWLYLATVMDLYSRRIVGWSLQDTLERRLTLEALALAVGQRGPRPGLLHHSDRGSQYACHDYQAALARHGMVASMSRRGDPYDNAAQESFFGSLKSELPRERWDTRAQARREVFAYLEVFYNRQRLHSSLGYLSPAAFELQSWAQAA
jgi:transposase InsO family protein